MASAMTAVSPDFTASEAVLAMLQIQHQMSAFIEVHIEQGPVLEELQQPLGAVSGIAGQARLWVTIAGEQGHAGAQITLNCIVGCCN